MAKVKKAQAGLKASNKRVGPVDPDGAWTKVQEMTLAGKKTPVSLKKDKELGATKMAKKGIRLKAQDGRKLQTIKKARGIKPNPFFELELEKLESQKRLERARLDEKRREDEAKMPKGIKTKAKGGKWIQSATASIKRRGTEGKCTPITKPGCTGRAKALAKTFKKMAKARKKK
jgi:hypothetical protein